MSIRLSIIVPVYNVSLYLEECVTSLLSQDISPSEYEIILVDDCSTDNSLTVAESLQRSVPNLQIIRHTINRGLSAARNSGLLAAKGNYINFIDSDDLVKPDSYGKLLLTAENNDLDILMCNLADHVDEKKMMLRSDKDSVLGRSIYRDDSKVFNGKSFLRLSTYNDGAVSFLLRKSFLLKNHFFFREGIYYEDLDFFYRVIYNCSRMISYSKSFYIVRNRQNSITRHNDKQKFKKSLEDMIVVLKNMQEFLKSLQEEKQIRHYLEQKRNTLTINTLALSKKALSNRDEAIELLSHLKLIGVYPLTFNFYKGMAFKSKLAYIWEYSEGRYLNSFPK